MARVRQTQDPAIVALAEELVAADPKGAPEVIQHTQKNESNDSGGSLSVPKSDPVADAPPPKEPFVPHVAKHALEEAPNGSKLVVSRTEVGKAVRLLTPSETVELPKSDITYKLRAGCKIQKKGIGIYQGFHLGTSSGVVFTADSVADAVDQFLRLPD